MIEKIIQFPPGPDVFVFEIMLTPADVGLMDMKVLHIAYMKLHQERLKYDAIRRAGECIMV